MTTINDLRDWTVTFTMHAGPNQREFTMTVPAAAREGAYTAAFGLAYAINEGSGYVWKIGQTISVEEIAR
jgi:hypothetical protein